MDKNSIHYRMYGILFVIIEKIIFLNKKIFCQNMSR